MEIYRENTCDLNLAECYPPDYGKSSSRSTCFFSLFSSNNISPSFFFLRAAKLEILLCNRVIRPQSILQLKIKTGRKLAARQASLFEISLQRLSFVFILFVNEMIGKRIERCARFIHLKCNKIDCHYFYVAIQFVRNRNESK